ncbi:MAG: hypothetical protein COZ18_09350 [Flexibacter sp. CG_4_10_14_3_um_filter_32_15]|nr:MAG: hypothetical protein COZ18_09350 [Flexibacter sp. CG_4_10_14_3_um_filter_32_15]
MVTVFLMSCEQRSEESIQIENITLDNGKYVEIEKTNKETTHIGLITKHNYGKTHSFKYQVNLKEDEIEWKGKKDQEPKHIIFCEDTIYMHYLEKQFIQTQTFDTLIQDTLYSSYYEVKAFFAKNIDERYLNNLFGSQLWEDISIQEYNTMKQKCKEYKVPNDEELVLGKVK